MTERGSLDDRLSTTVRAFADRARTQVDAVETAERAMNDGGRKRRLWSMRALRPMPVWLLLLLLLLLLAFTQALGAGGSRDSPALGDLTPTATAAAEAVSPTAVAKASPTATPDPLREAHVSGISQLTLVSPGQASQAGDETRVAGIAYDLQDDVDDARVAGSGRST